MVQGQPEGLRGGPAQRTRPVCAVRGEPLRTRLGGSLTRAFSACALHFEAQEIATRARVHRSSVSKHAETESLEVYMHRVVRVLSAAADANDGDILGAISWFRDCPIPELQHKTADELVTEGRADSVLAYLESIAAGYAG